MSRVNRDCENLGTARVDLGPLVMGEGDWTWEDAIRSAAEGIEVAYRHRRHVFRAAHEAGLSYRTIAAAASLSFNQVARDVARDIGGATKQKVAQADLLKQRAGESSPPPPEGAEN